MTDGAFIGMVRLLPRKVLSRFVGAATRWRAPAPVRHAAMRFYASAYGIDLSECEEIRGFDTFGEFFARALKPGLRPIAPGEDVVVSPVDAVVSESGVADDGRLVQAKGIDYTLGSLLADEGLAKGLDGGAYVTLYLSPRDYHRIHFPVGGRILGYRYVPGHLWPVTPAAVRRIPGLFCVNERLVTILDTALGLCAVVAVGATIVGRIRAYYDPEIPVTNRKHARPTRRDYEQPIPAEKGAELGAFELGSTVVLVFQKGRVELLPSVYLGARLRVGEPLGRQPALVTRV